MTAPITHSHGDRFARRGKLCRCAGCGAEEVCSPRFDFYTRSMDDVGELLCYPCLVRTSKEEPKEGELPW